MDFYLSWIFLEVLSFHLQQFSNNPDFGYTPKCKKSCELVDSNRDLITVHAVIVVKISQKSNTHDVLILNLNHQNIIIIMNVTVGPTNIILRAKLTNIGICKMDKLIIIIFTITFSESSKIRYSLLLASLILFNIRYYRVQ